MAEDQHPETGAAAAALVATQGVLAVIAASRGDVGPVFDAILSNAAQLCDAPLAWLALKNPDNATFTLSATHGDTPREFKVRETFALDAPFQLSRAIDEKRAINIADLKEGEL